jgi:GT2 family glycosyltransferase
MTNGGTIRKRESPRVVFIGVSFFGAESAGAFVRSLLQQTDGEWELHFVDNSASPVELSALHVYADLDRRIRVHESPENLGYFGAVSWMLPRLADLGDWLIICNVDVELGSADFIDRLLHMSNSVNAIAPRITSSPVLRELNPYLERPPTAAWAHRKLNLMRPILVAQLRGYAASILPYRRGVLDRVDRTFPIYAPHGSFIILRSALVRRFGPPIHPVFLFAEEFTVAEYLERARASLLYVPELRVSHREHQSTGRWKSRQMVRYQVEALHYIREVAARRDER